VSRILLIDDDPDVRDSVAKVLSREGHTVTTVDGAQKGLEMIVKEHFDVLIADLIMPGMDGVQAIRRIREVNGGIKIIAISGGGDFGAKRYRPHAITTTAYLEAAADAGADCVLTKPFERADIVDAVSQFEGGE